MQHAAAHRKQAAHSHRACRLSARENTLSYVELVHRLLGRATGLTLEVAVIAFGVGCVCAGQVLATYGSS